MPRKVIIIPDGTDSQKVAKDLHAALEALLRSDDLQFAYVGETSSEPGQHVLRWVEQLDGNVEVKLTIDEDSPARFVVVISTTPQTADVVTRAVVRSIGEVSLETLLVEARAPEPSPGALLRLGLGANRDATDDVVEALKLGLANPSEDVRFDAAMGASFLKSPRLAEALELSAASEPDEGVRDVMEWAHGLCAASNSP